MVLRQVGHAGRTGRALLGGSVHSRPGTLARSSRPEMRLHGGENHVGRPQRTERRLLDHRAGFQTRVLAEIKGPGTIVHFRDNITSNERHHLQLHILRIYWDGESEPSVEVPIGDFFGVGFGFTEKYNSALMCIDRTGGPSRTPRQTARHETAMFPCRLPGRHV